MRDGAPELLSGLLAALDPELRAAAVFALGSLIHSVPRMAAGSVLVGAAPDGRYGGAGGSVAASSAASLGVHASLGAGGSGAMAPGVTASASAASLGGDGLTAGPGSSGGGAAGGVAALEAVVAAEQSIAALLLRANVSRRTGTHALRRAADFTPAR